MQNKSALRGRRTNNHFFFSKHENKAEFKYLDDSKVLSNDFPGLKTSAASMTSVASMTSFHQNIY
jgi:hypothetical protein